MSQVFALPRFITRSSATSFVSINYRYCLTCNWLLFASGNLVSTQYQKELSLNTATTIIVLRGTRLMGSWRSVSGNREFFNLALTNKQFGC